MYGIRLCTENDDPVRGQRMQTLNRKEQHHIWGQKCEGVTLGIIEHQPLLPLLYLLHPERTLSCFQCGSIAILRRSRLSYGDTGVETTLLSDI